MGHGDRIAAAVHGGEFQLSHQVRLRNGYVIPRRSPAIERAIEGESVGLLVPRRGQRYKCLPTNDGRGHGRGFGVRAVPQATENVGPPAYGRPSGSNGAGEVPPQRQLGKPELGMHQNRRGVQAGWPGPEGTGIALLLAPTPELAGSRPGADMPVAGPDGIESDAALNLDRYRGALRTSVAQLPEMIVTPAPGLARRGKSAGRVGGCGETLNGDRGEADVGEHGSGSRNHVRGATGPDLAFLIGPPAVGGAVAGQAAGVPSGAEPGEGEIAC